MTQLIQVMRLTYLITETRQATYSTGQTLEKTAEGENDAEDTNIVDDWEDKDMLRRSWISSTLIEESMCSIVGCSTSNEMWECLEETYFQATKDKKFQIK